MSVGKKMLSTGEAFVDRVLCVVGAVVFSQMPEFMQQYLQRLGGRLDEARRHLAHYQKIADDTNVTLAELAARFNGSMDAATAKVGGVITDTVARVHELESAQAAIQNAGVFGRPFAFLRHVDPGIARDIWSIFKPAVPTTAEGGLYAVAGIVVLLGLYYGLIRHPIAWAWKRRNRAKAERMMAAAAAQPPERLE
ncbi:MAG: DUF2937 family protein [Opitutaceae bacterium]|jgi:hypothetical protein|nr:DUF2937 family protein [Opitutaceae bacterium]